MYLLSIFRGFCMENKYTKQNMIKDIIVFLTVACISFALCASGMICHAEGLEEVEEINNSFSGLYGYDFSTYGLWSIQGYNNSYFYDSDVYLPYDYVSPITESLLDTFDLTDYYETYPYFVFTQDYSNRNVYYLYLFTEPSMFVLYGNHSVGVRGSGSWLFLELNNSGPSLTLSSSTSYSGDLVMSSHYTHRFVFANIDVFGTTTNVSGDGLLSTSDYSNINYCLYDENGDLIYNNPIANGSTNGETSFNNLYLENCYFNFNGLDNISLSDNETIPFSTVNPFNGNINFIATLNDYQIEHSSEFELVFDFVPTLKFITYDESTDVALNHTTNYYGMFKGNSIVVPLSSLVQSGSYNFSPYDILRNNTYQFASLSRTYYDAWQFLKSKFGFSVNGSYWYLDCNVYLRSVNGNNTSGKLSQRYNYFTGKTSTNSDDIKINSNPYVNPDTGLPNDDSTPSDAVSSSSGGNTLINNDNDTIIIESNGEVAENIVNELIPSESNDNDFVERIEDITDSNEFLELIQTTYSFVPQSVFNYMKFYFEVGLGILACAFILRIVLDLL